MATRDPLGRGGALVRLSKMTVAVQRVARYLPSTSIVAWGASNFFADPFGGPLGAPPSADR